MPRIRAVVFDVDGTLLDTVELIRVGYITTLREFGFTKEADEFEVRSLSKPLKESYQAIVGSEVGESMLEQMLAHHRRVQDASVDVIAAHAGLESVLDTLHEKQLKLGIFTSGSVEHLQRNFRQVQVDMYKHFDAFATADDNHVPHKPAPDGLLLCLERLDISPEQAVFVGDHPADMLAGKAAGVAATIGVLHGLGRHEELTETGADYLLAALSDIPATIDAIEQV